MFPRFTYVESRLEIGSPEAFDADSPRELAEQAADQIKFVIRNERPESVAAILTEPIGGTSGGYPAPPGYFERLRKICDRYDVPVISDEVITGFGRCGDWSGIDTEGVVPDMITFAKGVTSAYVPLAGVIADDWIGDVVRDEGYDLGQTFAGHPVACAAGRAAIEAYDDHLIAPPFCVSRSEIERAVDAFDAAIAETFE